MEKNNVERYKYAIKRGFFRENVDRDDITIINFINGLDFWYLGLCNVQTFVLNIKKCNKEINFIAISWNTVNNIVHTYSKSSEIFF